MTLWCCQCEAPDPGSCWCPETRARSLIAGAIARSVQDAATVQSRTVHASDLD